MRFEACGGNSWVKSLNQVMDQSNPLHTTQAMPFMFGLEWGSGDPSGLEPGDLGCHWLFLVGKWAASQTFKPRESCWFSGNEKWKPCKLEPRFLLMRYVGNVGMNRFGDPE